MSGEVVQLDRYYVRGDVVWDRLENRSVGRQEAVDYMNYAVKVMSILEVTRKKIPGILSPEQRGEAP